MVGMTRRGSYHTGCATSDTRHQLLVNDFVAWPETCNLRCAYCLSKDAPAWQPVDFSTGVRRVRGDGGLKQLRATLGRFDELFDAPILRISGGEILMHEGIPELLAEQQGYEAVQIVTNGYFLDDAMLDRLAEIPNLSLHVSVDGHTFETNSLRVSKPGVHARLMANLERAIGQGLYVEVGSVLTRANTGSYPEFLSYLEGLGGRVVAYPFPIRGSELAQFYPERQDVEGLAASLRATHNPCLPPRAFIDLLTSMLLKKKRETRCIIPMGMIQLFHDGGMTACPNAWTHRIGNVHELDPSGLQEAIRRDPMQRVFLQPRPRIEFCRHCCTSLDVVSLYAIGEISDGEMAGIPIYSGPRAMAALRVLRARAGGVTETGWAGAECL